MLLVSSSYSPISNSSSKHSDDAKNRRPYLPQGVSLAAQLAAGLAVYVGPEEGVAQLEAELLVAGEAKCRQLTGTGPYGFHSPHFMGAVKVFGRAKNKFLSEILEIFELCRRK
jgi:hypothetical protein